MKPCYLILSILCFVQASLAHAFDSRYSPFQPGKEPARCVLKPVRWEGVTTPDDNFIRRIREKDIEMDLGFDTEGFAAQIIRNGGKRQSGEKIKIPGPLVGFDGVYTLNVTPDKKPDFVIFTRSAGLGYAAGYGWLTVIASHGDSYVISQIESYDSSLNDWVKKGNSCFLVQTASASVAKTLDGRNHNFFVHSLISFDAGKAAYANHLMPGFPKWILYSYDPNHSATRKRSPAHKKEAWDKRGFGRILKPEYVMEQSE